MQNDGVSYAKSQLYGQNKKINRYNNKKTMQIAIKLCDKLPMQERWQLKI